MNKSELINRVSAKVSEVIAVRGGIKSFRSIHEITELIVNNLFLQFIEGIKDDGQLQIKDFGTFVVKFVKDKEYHDPNTGKKFKKDYIGIRFRPGKFMRGRAEYYTKSLKDLK